MKTNQNESTIEVESMAATVVCGSELEQIAREGAQKMLQVALQLEVQQYIAGVVFKDGEEIDSAAA